MTKNILSCITSVSEYCKNTEASVLLKEKKETLFMNQFPEPQRKEIRFLKEYFGLDGRHSLLAALIFYITVENNFNRIRLDNISSFLRVKTMEVLPLFQDLDFLKKKRILSASTSMRSRFSEDFNYKVNPALMQSIIQNKPFRNEGVSAEDVWSFMDELNDVLKMRGSREISFEEMQASVFDLVDKSGNVQFCKNLKLSGYSVDEKFLMIVMGVRLVEGCREYAMDEMCGDITNSIRSKFELKRLLVKEACKIQMDGLIEIVADGFLGEDEVRLTEKGVDFIFDGEQSVVPSTKSKSKKAHLMCPNDLVEKELYYNEKESEQIRRIEKTLLNFDDIKQRLAAKGMSKGVAILLHGAPGTGKTETVYQLAKKTGRSIFQVSISEIKSKWFGESEKKIKQLFDDYRNEVMNSELEPILLFNEADAVLSRRSTGSNSSVAQTENAIQNIILQEMENLDGIMIATSNLTMNLDSAFERRFLFKVKFASPDVTVKSQIWKSKIPVIDQRDAERLASAYSLTGGQIDNISRKVTMEELLNGDVVTYDMIEKFCREERLDEFKAVGFR